MRIRPSDFILRLHSMDAHWRATAPLSFRRGLAQSEMMAHKGGRDDIQATVLQIIGSPLAYGLAYRWYVTVGKPEGGE